MERGCDGTAQTHVPCSSVVWSPPPDLQPYIGLIPPWPALFPFVPVYARCLFLYGYFLLSASPLVREIQTLRGFVQHMLQFLYQLRIYPGAGLSPNQSPCQMSLMSQWLWKQCLSNRYIYSTTDRKRADVARKSKNVCSTVRKCPVSNRFLLPHEIQTRHICGNAECLSCKQYHDLCHHQCYIQSPTKLEEKRKLLRSQKCKLVGSQSLEEKYFSTIY